MSGSSQFITRADGIDPDHLATWTNQGSGPITRQFIDNKVWNSNLQDSDEAEAGVMLIANRRWVL